MFITAVCVVFSIKEKSPGSEVVKEQTWFPGFLSLELKGAGSSLGTRWALRLEFRLRQPKEATKCFGVFTDVWGSHVRLRGNENNGLLGLITN